MKSKNLIARLEDELDNLRLEKQKNSLIQGDQEQQEILKRNS